ncbi:MAG: hypothetical protein JOZ10_11350 [Acidobacteria bacterium]|nr:hypothetical protein [Acidobacteriota bacterium]
MSRFLLSRCILALLALLLCSLVWGGNTARYKVLDPISHGNLTVFPVVASNTHDTTQFITLDEGIRSGEVVVTEAGRLGGLIRGPHPRIPSGPQVNNLVLVNNSKRPLILLAGEIVTGGKQDRVVAKDRVVPAESDPVDLGVFCVEPGRWTETSTQFSTMKSQMAQPSVRRKAMVAQNQQQVWDSVGRANDAIAAAASPVPTGGPIYTPNGGQTVYAERGVTSYAKVFDEEKNKQWISQDAAPVEQSYSSLIKRLRDQHAVGVVVAVGGQLIWADLFASTDLLEKYWPKLVRSYAAEAITTHAATKSLGAAEAQKFLERMEGTHETSDTEPGVYRQSEAIAPEFKVFTLASLLPGTGFDLHVSKIADAPSPEVGIIHPPRPWNEGPR